VTTFDKIEQTCILCGTVSEHGVHPSSNSYDTELDGCPVGMARDAHVGEPLRCPKCGYCSPDLSFSAEGLAEFVESPVYQGALGAPGMPELVARCICASGVTDLAGYLGDSYNFRMMAAYLCDDAGMEADARACRQSALTTLDEVLGKGYLVAHDRIDQLIVVADLCRRTGQFDKAAEPSAVLLAELAADPGDWRLPVAEFQAALIAGEDDQAHTYGEAAEECRYPWIFVGNQSIPFAEVDPEDPTGWME
jgi:hypothetical protein